jgi:hypothetical protein
MATLLLRATSETAGLAAGAVSVVSEIVRLVANPSHAARAENAAQTIVNRTRVDAVNQRELRLALFKRPSHPVFAESFGSRLVQRSDEFIPRPPRKLAGVINAGFQRAALPP